jgi:di/tricarboxylate transporter
LSAEQILFLCILAGALALFVSERVRIDVAAMLTLLALTFSGILTPAEALAGFSSEPAIIVAAVFIISAGLSATGFTDRVGTLIARASGASEWRAILVMMPATAVLSSLSHHLMVTAMMLPVVMKFARDHKLHASRLLMPMSLAASLGTTLTLFSAPAFLLADNLLKARHAGGLSIFAITPIGIALVVIGIVYMSLGRWLLPRRTAQADETDYLQLDRYYTELIVEPESPWTEQSIKEFQKHFEGRLDIVEWLRGGSRHRGTATEDALAVGDVLLVRASPDEIASVKDEPGLELHAVAKYGDSAEKKPGEDSEEHQLIQVIVAPGSRFIGRTIGAIDFLKNLGVIVVGLWRKEGWMRTEISDVRLREGDLLVLSGAPRTYAALSNDRGFLMMVPFAAKARRRNRAWAAIGIVLTAVVAAAMSWVPTPIAFLAGAVALVVTGCVGLTQAYRQIDVRIFVMIAGVIPLGTAMQKTGTAAFLAEFLQKITSDWSPTAVLLALFWAAALVTQILSDAATVVLLGPIALALAVALGQPPQAFVVCTALGAVVAFLTPIGHHGNLLILNPGQYTFADFLKIGVPLTILISLASVWLAQWLWVA